MALRDDDFRITPAQRAYLAAFDYWLKHSWATGKTGAQHDGASDVKDACFDAMTAEAGAEIPFYRDIRRKHPTLPDVQRECPCGNVFTLRTLIGRPRTRCYECRPAKIKAAA